MSKDSFQQLALQLHELFDTFADTFAGRARRIELRGRVVMITGGGRGLGLAIAREFLQRGCRLALCGRGGEVIARATGNFRRQGADVFGAACGASDPAQVEAFVAQVLERFGRIDVLVNNAGQCFVGPAVELQPGDVEEALRHIFWTHYPTSGATSPPPARSEEPSASAPHSFQAVAVHVILPPCGEPGERGLPQHSPDLR